MVALGLALQLPATGAWAADPTDEPVGAEDAGAERHAVRIPEPLVFDLVRPLGALQGELEVNTLVLLPMNDWSDRDVEWAPEIELAIFDGVALEFELPFRDDRLDAFKLAGQLTFGTGFDERFIHGTQFIAEKDRDDDVWELTPLYVAGFRFDEYWSVLGMLGYRGEVGSDSRDRNELIANFSAFRDVTPHATLGLETNFAADFEGDYHLLILPQLHSELTDHLGLQLGAGVEVNSDDADGTAGLRFIASW